MSDKVIEIENLSLSYENDNSTFVSKFYEYPSTASNIKI